MAYLVDELNRRNEHQLPRPKVCYYYCHNDETGQAIHILSVLVLALLEQLAGLKRTFYEWYKERQASGILEPATSTRMLEQFLEGVLVTLDRLLFIVIDGLDERDRSTLSNKTLRLKILLSSRPEEEISEQLDQVPRIHMESDANRDAVIVRHTVEGQLSHLSADVKTLVTETLSRLAQGIREIRALGPMRLFLDEMPLPGQLSSLYDTLLLRSSSNDPENQNVAALALALLAVACRPLSIQELAWAVTLAAAQHKVVTVSALAQLVDHQRVMSLIHPFITRVDFADLRKRQVQLVYQSVREFIIRKWSHWQGSVSPLALDQAITHYSMKTLEAFILDICIKYLLLYEIGSTPLFSEEQVAIDELPQDVDLFADRESFEYDRYCTWETWEENMIRYDPTERGFGGFFVYASSYWLKHFGDIESELLLSLAEIESVCQARFEFYSHLYDPLSITSLYGSDSILRDMLTNSNFDEDKYLRSPAIAAADQILQWGNLSKLRILFLEGKLTHQLRNLEFFRLIIRQWSNLGARHEDWEMAFSLVDHVLDIIVEEQWGNELLCLAARAGCMPMIERLLNQARLNAKLKTELLRGFQSIGEAVLGNHLVVDLVTQRCSAFWFPVYSRAYIRLTIVDIQY
ncbi:hypothetical protein EK21DRAFT_105415 [Setomelanomma holmii]|uniref:Nephrocystin 3-like N-terminal domain-containing protein n=1 Tax=Setomelanomma holmii TaxID=210430 RepID=A0A9P4GXD9_9PLEO|nr:hypothetical protein EK21DRAFT_105415 [Setomelanomma holmii]